MHFLDISNVISFFEGQAKEFLETKINEKQKKVFKAQKKLEQKFFSNSVAILNDNERKSLQSIINRESSSAFIKTVFDHNDDRALIVWFGGKVAITDDSKVIIKRDFHRKPHTFFGFEFSELIQRFGWMLFFSIFTSVTQDTFHWQALSWLGVLISVLMFYFPPFVFTVEKDSDCDVYTKFNDFFASMEKILLDKHSTLAEKLTASAYLDAKLRTLRTILEFRRFELNGKITVFFNRAQFDFVPKEYMGQPCFMLIAGKKDSDDGTLIPIPIKFSDYGTLISNLS